MEDKLIYKKIGEILKSVSPVSKDRKNAQQGYNFRGIDDMYNELHSHFSEHGVFITSEVKNNRREERPSKGGGILIWTIVDVAFTFIAEDGSTVQSTMVGEAMDSGDKGCNKAMSAALKYALMQMFLIPTEDKKDSENDTPEIKDPAVIMKEECLNLINKATELADLKTIKAMYKDLIDKDNSVYKAIAAKGKELTPAAPAQS